MKKSERRMKFDKTRPGEIVLSQDVQKESDPARYCSTVGKIMHESEAAAERAAGHQMKQGSVRLRTYYCLYCSHYHLSKE